MPKGRLTRRTRPRLARGFAVLLFSLAAAGGAGCQRFPLRYTEVTPESTSKPTTKVESAKPDPNPPGEIAPMPATPLPDAPKADPSTAIEPAPSTPEAAPAPAVAPPQSSATPLIDEALKRAEAVTGPVVDVAPAPDPAKVEPAAEAPMPADAPVELPMAVKPVAETAAPAPAPPVKDADAGKAEIPSEFESADVPRTPDPLEVAAAPATAPVQAAAPAPAPEPKAIDPEKPAEPRDEWREGLTQVRAVALRRAGEPGDAAQAWAIRARVLDWLAGEGPEPAGETGRAWNSVLATLSTATGPETPDPTTLAYHLDAAVETLESYAPIQITALSFCRKIDGFGHYEPVDAPSVRAGQPLLVYCEMSGLRYEEDRDGFRSRLSSRVEVIPAGGGDVVWSEALGTAEDLCRRRRRDYFVNYRIVTPARLAPGSYALRLSQTDLVSNRSVTADVPFTVKP